MFLDILNGLLVLLLMVMFIGMCLWAWSPKRKTEFDAIANLPLQHDKPQNGVQKNDE